MPRSLQFLGISGSLRRKSYNTAALRAAMGMLPEGVTMDTFDLAPLPLYNEDVRESGFPEHVQKFRDSIAAADALLIVTPEYNASIPGVLKNAIDWASRPPAQPFDGKPIAIIGASPGMLGTSRCQYHLRQCFVALNGMLLNRPEVMISAANTKFDEQGTLTDAKTREFIQKLLVSLADWTERLQSSRK